MPYCPSQEEIHETLMALLPPGRAFQNFDAGVPRTISNMQKVIYSLAAEFKIVEDDICQAWNEFFCETADVDLDLWQLDYGLPDECDPFGDNLCGKVAAVGGTSIEYYMDVAASLGWSTEMRWLKGDDAEFPGIVSTLYIVIDGEASEANFEVTTVANAIVGISRLGDPDTSLLACALDRIIPAHCAIQYEVI